MKAADRVQDRYTLVEPLGRGGMAEVWLARDERLERDVAIKFMATNLCHDPEFLVRFFSEAQAVARISHPNVVSVLDFGDFEDRPYLVMECVPGGALANLTGEPMLPERAAEIVAAAARGAGAAHRAGLVHRDLKPANILLDEAGEPKLADFGIASSTVSEKLTATGTAIGSPHYVSPEQASGHAVTAASDVYSLGAVLYELLTGRPPFEADNVTAIAIAHVEQPPVPPSARVEGIPERLDAVVLSCLVKDPAARPRDGDALADALEDEASATAWIPAAVEPDDDLEPYEEPRVRKRRLVPALLLASLALVLAGAMYVSGRPDDAARAGTDERPKLDAPEEKKRRDGATPAPTAYEPTAAPVAVPVAAPSPTPTPAPEEDPTPTPRPDDEEDEPLWTPAPTQEPEPSEEPVPSEEPAPSEEPPTTPAPGAP
ncbi:MAG TPA: serine/threonine-protein kinase [Actinomycetota bacterium]|nr:serine/threonine-protein kinase [Actinomycetota bacterium]